MRLGMLLVASGVSVALAGSACSSPCRAIAAERDALRARTGRARTPHARVQVPYGEANRVLAEVLADPPAVPIATRRLGPLQPFVGELHAVPRSMVLAPARPGRVRIDLRIEVRDHGGELVTLKATTEVEPVLARAQDGRQQLVIALGAEQVLRFEPELGPRADAALGQLLESRLPGPVRGRIPHAMIDRAAGELLGELVEHGYRLLRRPLLRRLGELTAIRVRLPDLPVARVDVRSTVIGAPALELELHTPLPVRAGLSDAPPAPADAVAVQIAGSTVAELANWAVDRGVLPRRYTRSGKPDPDGPFVPHIDWRPDDPHRPLVVHLFQVERGCAHFQVGARPLLAVRDGMLVATLRDRRLERAQGPPLVRMAAWLKRLVERSIDRSRKAAAATQVTVGGRVLATQLTRAEVAGNEVHFALRLASGGRRAKPSVNAPRDHH
jgi:hypothetical protein